jgi:hypothetical protein
VLTGTHPEFRIQVTCNGATDGCAQYGQYAHMSDNTQTMNFCPRFFAAPVTGQTVDDTLKVTQTLINTCGTNFNLRTAQRARSAIIIHECSHTEFAMNGPKTLDYAYGFIGCSQLPQGLFDRACARYARPGKVVCPNNAGVEGFCSGQTSIRNADTYAFIAAGVFFEQKCGRPVPYPQLTALLKTRSDVGSRGNEAVTYVAREESSNINLEKKQNSRHMGKRTQRSRELNNAVQHSGDDHQTPNGSYIDPIRELLKEKRQADSCPLVDDYLIIDREEDGISVPGHVHFGDSYASGMGTGTTSTDSCRVGSNNCEYPHFYHCPITMCTVNGYCGRAKLIYIPYIYF